MELTAIPPQDWLHSSNLWETINAVKRADRPRFAACTARGGVGDGHSQSQAHAPGQRLVEGWGSRLEGRQISDPASPAGPKPRFPPENGPCQTSRGPPSYKLRTGYVQAAYTLRPRGRTGQTPSRTRSLSARRPWESGRARVRRLVLPAPTASLRLTRLRLGAPLTSKAPNAISSTELWTCCCSPGSSSR
jgi:hypothetical protein